MRIVDHDELRPTGAGAQCAQPGSELGRRTWVTNLGGECRSQQAPGLRFGDGEQSPVFGCHAAENIEAGYVAD